MHELAHPMAMRTWGRSEQEDADLVVHEILGVRLRYAGPLLIQRVSAPVAARILGGRR